MSNFSQEHGEPREPDRLELAAAAIDPYLFEDFEGNEEVFMNITKVLGAETSHAIKQIWLSDMRLAFLKGAVNQAERPGLATEILQILEAES